MMSLSREWAALSRAMYGEEFIDELADFLRGLEVKSVLECGCGDGNVLHGLAVRGFLGFGIDADAEMIEMAYRNSPHSRVGYRKMDWNELGSWDGDWDCVMCRGNSLVSVAWGLENVNFDAESVRKKIEEGLSKMFARVKRKGILYVDTTSQKEIDGGSRDVRISLPGIELGGRIEHSARTRRRKVYGNGIVNGERFEGGSMSYLMSPGDLIEMIFDIRPSKIWQPKLAHETNYDIVCARK